MTLIELMTVLVVLAIMASLAVPSYRQYVLRSQRTDATAALLRIRAAQEKFFLQRLRYSADLVSAPPDGLGLPAVSEHGHYQLRLEVAAGGMGYRAIAAPVPGGGQADDARCTELSIDAAGRRRAAGAAADPDSECWR